MNRNEPPAREEPALRRYAAILIASLVFAVPAGAQEIRGFVRDSASRAPIAGAVVVLLAPDGATLDRGLTNGEGIFAVGPAPAAQRIRVLRIGFRPREIQLDGRPIDVAMTKVNAMLEAVTVTASSCPTRSDRGSALSVYEQARAGLLAMVVARQRRGNFVIVRYDQTMRGTTDRVERNIVRIDSSTRSNVAFTAALDAKDFLEAGFGRQRADGFEFLAPDADVLLDDRFARGYCFHITAPSAERPNQIGLGFAAPRREANRVDVEGTLWVDTLGRALRDIEFRYVGLEPVIERLGPGGSISFGEMRNGNVLITRWRMRLVGAVNYTVTERRRGGRDEAVEKSDLVASVSGGELATARWPDGTVFHAPLGRLRLRAVRADGSPAAGVRLQLVDTPFGGSTDSAGVLQVSRLVSGPYEVVVLDSAMQRVGLTLPTGVRFNASSDSTHDARVVVHTIDDYIRDRCMDEGTAADRDHGVLLARVMEAGEPVRNAEWRVTGNRLGQWKGGATGSDGVFQICSVRLAPGDVVRVQAWTKSASIDTSAVITSPATPVRLELKRR